MGCSIKFVRLDDFIADVDVLDLSTNGYSLAADGYSQVVAPIGAKSVREVITLKLQGTSKDNLATLTQAIDDKVRQVEWWIKEPGIEKYQVWMRVQLENETYPRQAQILNIQPPDKVRVYTPMEIGANYIGEYQIGIERTPFWEDPYPYPTTTAINDLDIIGGAATISETINGDVPARVARFTALGSSSSGDITDVWAGWKTSRFGTLANFEPVWSLDKGIVIDSADTSETGDATAYDNNKVRTTFSTNATLILRQIVRLTDVAPSALEDQRGTYQVLLRAKMSDASIARVQMSYGFYSAGAIQSPIFRSRAVISGTAWFLYEMGTASIPATRLPNGYSMRNAAFGMYAERLSGSGALDMDCLILIPIDDSGVKMTSSHSLASSQLAEVFTAANGDLYATAQHQSGQSIYAVVPKPQGLWSLPANGEAPLLVIAANDATDGCTKGKTLDFTYAYIPRWRTLRGNDT